MFSSPSTSQTPPRAIVGCVGSRVRVALGETGDDYLLLLDHDDGDTKWQSQHWRGIPNNLAKQINNCNKKGRYVNQVDFDTQGPWYVYGIKRDGTGGHAWWGGTENGDSIMESVNSSDATQVCFGADDYCESCVVISGRNGYSYRNVPGVLSKRIKRINKARKAIKFVRLFNDGQFFINDDEGTQWIVHGGHFGKELKKHYSNNVFDVALANDGSWIIIGEKNYVASRGVSNELTKTLDEFYNKQKTRNSKRASDIRLFHERKEVAEREMREAEAERLRREELLRQEEEEERQRVVEERKRIRQEVLDNEKEEELLQEADDIRHLQEHINNRKRALQNSATSLPPARRARVQERWSLSDSISESNTCHANCVVCHENEAQLAIVPCGHVCLCSECAPQMLQHTGGSNRSCPICRGDVQSTLKIFLQ